METGRREIAKFGVAAIVTAMASGRILAAGVADTIQAGRFPLDAWHQRLKRITQINFTEHDAASLDVGEWIRYLVAAKTECTFISITNNVAFYPSALPDLPRSRWLDGRDIVGECVRAAKAANIRILGRLSIDTARASLAQRHPEWFRRDAAGKILVATTSFSRADGTDPSASLEYARTCQFSDYYSTFTPQLIDEVMERYGIDGLYTNGWPGANVPPCFCSTCHKIGDPGSETYRLAYQKRTMELWALYTRTVAARDPKALFSGNLGGGIKGGELDLQPLVDQAPWMFADNQGRGEETTPSWDSSQQTRVARALSGSRPAVVSTAAWTFIGPAAWRTVTGNPVEVRTRLHQTLAAGGTMHFHWLGFDQGFHEDRRWQAIGREVMTWQAANDAHFHNLSAIANVALVTSPRTNRLYKAPPGTDGMDPFQGAYRILTEGRVPFELVLDTDLSFERLRRFAVLILPNVAIMSDTQAAQIKDFVARGGSVLTTFETGLYDTDGRARADFALGATFGMRKAGERVGYGAASAGDGRRLPGAPSTQRIERPHPILEGFRDTRWIQGSSWRIPIAASGPPILTDVPQHAVYPVEAVFPTTPKTDVPTMIVRERGKARLVHLAGDIEGGYWRSSAGDLGDLVLAAIRWLMRDALPLRVSGGGLLEVFGWRTEPGYAVHLVNHTNPNFRGGALRATYFVGPQRVALELEATTPIREIRLLRAGTPLPFEQNGASVTFTVPGVDDYEVAALVL